MFRGELRNQVSILSALCGGFPSGRSVHKLVVQGVRHERVRQRSEIRLEDGGDAADVVELVLVPKVEGGVVAPLEQLGDNLRLTGPSGLAIDALVFQR